VRFHTSTISFRCIIFFFLTTSKAVSFKFDQLSLLVLFMRTEGLAGHDSSTTQSKIPQMPAFFFLVFYYFYFIPIGSSTTAKRCIPHFLLNTYLKNCILRLHYYVLWKVHQLKLQMKTTCKKIWKSSEDSIVIHQILQSVMFNLKFQIL